MKVMGVINVIKQQLLNEYYISLKENELTPNTIRGYVTSLSQLNDYLAKNDYELTKANLVNYKDYLIAEKLKISTINQKITLINMFLKWLVVNDHLDEQFEKIKLKQLKTQIQNNRKFLTAKQQNRLIKVIDKDEFALLVTVAANTMLRIGAITSIKKKHLEESTFEIWSKGKLINVTFPLWLKRELKSYFKNKNDDEILFSKSQQYYSKVLKKYAVEANVPPERVYPHAFRHRAAKDYIKATGDISTLQQILAHSSLTTTQIYTQLSSDDLADIQRKMKTGKNKFKK